MAAGHLSIMLGCQLGRSGHVRIFMRLQTGLAIRQGQCFDRGESDCCLHSVSYHMAVEDLCSNSSEQGAY